MIRSSLRAVSALGILLLGSSPMLAEAPAIARPEVASSREAPGGSPGLVFFLATRSSPGAAAVGTAHTIALKRLAEASRVDFFLANSHALAASSRAFLVPPGRPFSLPNATLVDDVVVYALEASPRGVRVLEPEPNSDLALNSRVRILGVPSRGREDEEGIFGRVMERTPTRLDIELDIAHDLTGWGGAPILLARTGRVVGILQAYMPHGSTDLLIAAPISGVVEGLKRPINDGRGRPFAAFTKKAEGTARADSDSRKPRPSKLDRTEPVLAHGSDEPMQVHLEIDYPADGAIVAESICGVFISGRAQALRDQMQRFNVVMVIDTSRSTVDPAGSDINGNGVVGQRVLGRIGAIFGSGSTDPGDSILAAEVAAARQLMRGFDPHSTRVALVVFAGDPAGSQWSRSRPAYTLEPLTDDYRRIDRGLDDVLNRNPEGSTHMAAGIDRATVELLGLQGSISTPDPRAEKIMFFFTDGQPTLPYGPGMEADNVRAVLRAANRAKRGGIRIHSFAIGPSALEGPIAAVEMASRTDGYFTPVRHPGDLVTLVNEISFANLDEVRITSDTTGAEAKPSRLNADGSWAGLLRMEPGKNRIRVRARASDGAETEKVIEITFVQDAPTPPLPDDFAPQRNRLLEDCLRETRQLRVRTEQENAERVRRELKLEIDRERAAATQRANEQRKQLKLEVDDDEVDE